jgi:hypothetical protein
VEILGDDEEDRSAADRPPVDPRTTAWAPGTTPFRSAAPTDRSATGREPQAGRGEPAQRLRSLAGPVTGSAAALDLGEQARDPAWEQLWNTGPVPLSTVRVDAAPDGAPEAHTAPDAGAHAAAPPAAVPSAAPLGPRAQLIATVASSESLGVAGVLIALATSIASFPSLFGLMGSGGNSRSMFDAFAMAFALGGVLAAALGVAACLRLRPDSHPIVRGLAGAAVILGLVLVTLAAFTAIQAGDVPTGVDTTGSA